MDSDKPPVNTEIQHLIPNLLEVSLATVWANRTDWFFGIDMGIYYDAEKSPLVPDGFLSLGVERFIGEEGRNHYVLWEEDWIVPTLVLEVVCDPYTVDYERKKADYAALGIQYYGIYVPSRRYRRRPTLEVFQWMNGDYSLMPGDRILLPGIGLALGADQGSYLGWEREWLYWFDRAGNRLPSPETLVKQERQRAIATAQELQAIRKKLRRRGIDPDTL
ncbi:MAG: Uma2 family endonuclease [Leptolyngbya sp. SIO1D8]|nr:Uma2 family endonuclease [Leptolyngbya sp. SIO1D8]